MLALPAGVDAGAVRAIFSAAVSAHLQFKLGVPDRRGSTTESYAAADDPQAPLLVAVFSRL